MMLEIAPESLAPGRVIGDYRLERPLGEGGMGVVWAAREKRTDEAVALKFLRPDRGISDKDRTRFLREARAAMAISHPHVAKVHAVLETDVGVPYLVMDLLEGESLRSVLRRRGALTVAECARIFVPVVSAVEAAHAMGIVHRDLKPENVFLVGGHDVRVLDFGIAKQMPRADDATASASLTSTGAVLGTPQYMAPEQVFGDEDLDGRADAWAIGVMLFECIAGKRPIDGSGFGPIIKGITVDPIPPLTFAYGGSVPEIAALVQRLLSRNRDARPPLSEVRDVLLRATTATTQETLQERMHVPALDRSPTTTAAVASKRDPGTTTKTKSAVPVALGAVVATALVAGIALTAIELARRPHAIASSAPEAAAGGEDAALVVNEDVTDAASVDESPDASLVTLPPRGHTTATAEAEGSHHGHSQAARVALERRDGATCLRELDAFDRVEAKPQDRSTNPSSSLAPSRATCMMLAGDCEGGKALYKKAKMAKGLTTAADAEEAASAAAAKYCTGPNMSPYDQLKSAATNLRAAADGGRSVTPAQCMQWYTTIQRLLPTVAPRSPNDDIKYIPMRLMQDAPACLMHAGDCAGSYRVFAQEYARNRPHIADPAERERDIKGEYRVLANQHDRCRGTPP